MECKKICLKQSIRDNLPEGHHTGLGDPLLSLLRLTSSHRSSFLQHEGQITISATYMPKVALLGQRNGGVSYCKENNTWSEI